MTEESKFTTTHAGAPIWFNEGSELWSARIDGRTDITDSSLRELKKKIERVLKPKVNERRPAIKLGGGFGDSNDEFVTVTSFDRDGRYPFAWITDASKSRSKVSLDSVRADTPENRERAAKRNELRAQIKRLNREVLVLADQMTRIDVPAESET